MPTNDTENFQHYQVLHREDGTLWELGRGAMGVTYKAFDVNLRCHVALKVINAQFLDSEMARARFLREARAAAGLRHRNVASVYHLGDDADSFFYSMEFIDGQTVEDLVTENGPLSAETSLRVARQVARALGAAAKQGVVHRDIKPANLMIVHEDDEEDMEDGGFLVKVIDFGLARSAVAGGEGSGHITMGGFVGTPQYASPEQIEEKDLDTRSDIYSLGVTLWYMLAGRPPFAGTVFRISSQHLNQEPPWEDIHATVPPPVRELLGQMLEKDPERRPQTPGKLRTEIDACLRQLTAADALPAPGAPATALPGGDSRFEDGELEEGSATVVQGPPPMAGRIFAARYQLSEQVGEGASGRTFRAYDGRLDGKLVAVKVLHPELRLSPQAFYHLQGDLGRLRDAPHPQLIDTFRLERVHGHKFSVMEWVNGYPLARVVWPGGALDLRDALRLLGLLADAAAHCSAHRLHRLELSPQKILLHFPGLDEDDPPPAESELAGRALGDWPAFLLKVDALSPAREAGGTSARGDGGAARSPARDTFSSIRGLVEGSYFYALGALLHELLGGKPPTPDRPDISPTLSGLSAAANGVLERAFLTNPGFATENEWFQALLEACGLRREDVGLGRPQADDPTPSSVRTTVRADRAEAQTFTPPPTAPPAPPHVTPVVPEPEKTMPPMQTGNAGSVRPVPSEAHTVTPDRADTLARTEGVRLRVPLPVVPRVTPLLRIPLPADARKASTASPPPAPTLPKSASAVPEAVAWEEAPAALEPVPPAAPSPVESIAPMAPGEDFARTERHAPEPEPMADPGETETFAAAETPGSFTAQDVESFPTTRPVQKSKGFPWFPVAIAAVVVLGAVLAIPALLKNRPVNSRPEAAAVRPVSPAPSAPAPVETPTRDAAFVPEAGPVTAAPSPSGPVATPNVPSSPTTLAEAPAREAAPVPAATPSTTPEQTPLADNGAEVPPAPVIQATPSPAASSDSQSAVSIQSGPTKGPTVSASRNKSASASAGAPKTSPAARPVTAGKPKVPVAKPPAKPTPVPPRRNDEDVPAFMR